MRKIFLKLEHGANVLSAIILFTLMSMTFFDVLLRSLFNSPLGMAPELTRIFLALIVFLSMPAVSVRGHQITVDLLDPIAEHLNLVHQQRSVAAIICGVMLIWPTQRIWLLAERARSYGDVTEYLSIPTFWLGWFIAVMVGVTSLGLILQGALSLFASKSTESKT